MTPAVDEKLVKSAANLAGVSTTVVGQHSEHLCRPERRQARHQRGCGPRNSRRYLRNENSRSGHHPPPRLSPRLPWPVSASKKYTFKVAHGATKVDVKRAAEELFGVKVAKVNTISVRGRYAPPGPATAATPAASKKAIVTLTAGFQGHRVLRDLWCNRPAGPVKSLRQGSAMEIRHLR